ncbi:DoxX family protein [Siminovitchia sediminis]|uniref:DoxX family protein n=1 Tax=Siminovitchia sediminis TaxID=1274353 RepID=A0ABW4KGE6_9BACI
MHVIRWAVAFVFIVSGVMKWLNPEMAETFAQLRLPFPEQFMWTLAVIEVVCGVMLLINKWVKLAAFALIGIMAAALILTKIPLLSSGLMDFLFAARLDMVMLLLLFGIYHKPAT